MKKLYTILPFFLALIILSSCEENNENEIIDNDKITIVDGVSKSGDYRITVLAEDSLFQGYNNLYFKVSNASSEEIIEDVSLKLHPLMDMMTMVHAAPVENPIYSSDEKLYEGAVVFIMPSTAMMGWSLMVAMEHNGVKDTVGFQLPMVRNLNEVKNINLISDIDGTRYFISLIEPTDPEVGINDIEFAVHYRQNMMSFPAAEDIEISFEPEMPSMNHGSPNNVMPVHNKMGHYTGKINFTMTGWWRVHLTLKKGGEIIKDDAYFDITFQ